MGDAVSRSPFFDAYDEADARRRERIRAVGGVIAPSGAVLYPTKSIPPAPILPPIEPDDDPAEPAMPGLLGWLISLITTR